MDRETADREAADRETMDRDWIAARIPHQHDMCLLDAVLHWTPDMILCAATSHRAASHPMRQFGRLGAACGIEYAAQAMALHGALRAAAPDAPPAPGLLVSARDVTLHVARLDDIAADLAIQADRTGGDTGLIAYRFAVRAGGRLLVEGRAAVMLAAAAALA